MPARVARVQGSHGCGLSLGRLGAVGLGLRRLWLIARRLWRRRPNRVPCVAWGPPGPAQAARLLIEDCGSHMHGRLEGRLYAAQDSEASRALGLRAGRAGAALDHVSTPYAILGAALDHVSTPYAILGAALDHAALGGGVRPHPQRCAALLPPLRRGDGGPAHRQGVPGCAPPARPPACPPALLHPALPFPPPSIPPPLARTPNHPASGSTMNEVRTGRA